MRHLTAIALAAIVLAACNLPIGSGPAVGHTITPGAPAFSQAIADCPTSGQAKLPPPIEPLAGCDAWSLNRYERPFNPQFQDAYYPDHDLEQAELGLAGGWYFLRLELHDVDPDGQGLTAVYAVEFDLDLDGRGDRLIAVRQPAEVPAAGWAVAGVTVWLDRNNDVGDQLPLQPDPPAQGGGYEELMFDQGHGDDPDLAWARATFDQPAIVEIAFKPAAIDGASIFKWWAWADSGVADPSAADYHDAFDLTQAGVPYRDSDHFPARQIYAVDSTCASLWGAPPTDDPTLCENLDRPPTTSVPGGTVSPTPPDGTGTPPTPDETRSATPSPTPTSTWATITVFIPSPTRTRTATPRTPQTTPTTCLDVAGAPGCTPTPSVTPTPRPSPTPRTPPPTACLNPLGLPCTPTPVP